MAHGRARARFAHPDHDAPGGPARDAALAQLERDALRAGQVLADKNGRTVYIYNCGDDAMDQQACEAACGRQIETCLADD